MSIPYKFEDYEALEQYIPKRDRVIIKVRLVCHGNLNIGCFRMNSSGYSYWLFIH
jgi:hypothetical protein